MNNERIKLSIYTSFVLISFIFSHFTFASTIPKCKNEKECLAQADKYYDKRELDKTVIYCKKVININPQNNNVYEK